MENSRIKIPVKYCVLISIMLLIILLNGRLSAQAQVGRRGMGGRGGLLVRDTMNGRGNMLRASDEMYTVYIEKSKGPLASIKEVITDLSEDQLKRLNDINEILMSDVQEFDAKNKKIPRPMPNNPNYPVVMQKSKDELLKLHANGNLMIIRHEIAMQDILTTAQAEKWQTFRLTTQVNSNFNDIGLSGAQREKLDGLVASTGKALADAKTVADVFRIRADFWKNASQNNLSDKQVVLLLVGSDIPLYIFEPGGRRARDRTANPPLVEIVTDLSDKQIEELTAENDKRKTALGIDSELAIQAILTSAQAEKWQTYRLKKQADTCFDSDVESIGLSDAQHKELDDLVASAGKALEDAKTADEVYKIRADFWKKTLQNDLSDEQVVLLFDRNLVPTVILAP